MLNRIRMISSLILATQIVFRQRPLHPTALGCYMNGCHFGWNIYILESLDLELGRLELGASQATFVVTYLRSEGGATSKYWQDCKPVWGQPRAHLRRSAKISRVQGCWRSALSARIRSLRLDIRLVQLYKSYHQSQDEWLNMKGHDLNLVNPTPFKFQGEILLRHNPEPERMLRCCG